MFSNAPARGSVNFCINAFPLYSSVSLQAPVVAVPRKTEDAAAASTGLVRNGAAASPENRRNRLESFALASASRARVFACGFFNCAFLFEDEGGKLFCLSLRWRLELESSALSTPLDDGSTESTTHRDPRINRLGFLTRRAQYRGPGLILWHGLRPRRCKSPANFSCRCPFQGTVMECVFVYSLFRRVIYTCVKKLAPPLSTSQLVDEMNVGRVLHRRCQA